MPIAEEIYKLAKHHKEILEHKFPSYRYQYRYLLTESTSHIPHPLAHPGSGSRLILRVDYAGEHQLLILVASFSPSFLRISTSNGSKLIYYADPEFTDSVISKELRVLEVDDDVSVDDAMDSWQLLVDADGP